MTTPAEVREQVPGDPYYNALEKAFNYNGGSELNWAGVKWMRIKRNGRAVFVNCGLMSQQDVAYGMVSTGYQGVGFETPNPAPLEQAPAPTYDEGIVVIGDQGAPVDSPVTVITAEPEPPATAETFVEPPPVTKPKGGVRKVK